VSYFKESGLCMQNKRQDELISPSDAASTEEFQHRSVIRELLGASPNRRKFFKTLGVASAMAGAVAAVEGTAQAQTAFTDFDILNFALNLEYLEAEFYTYATSGQSITQMGLSVAGTGASGATTGGSKVNFTSPMALSIANELAFDERTHVTLIQNSIAALGGTSIAKPAINLNALGIGFGSQNDFLVLARVFEDIGVTAYAGAATLIKSSLVLNYAARILATEAFHAANIRLQIAQAGITTSALDNADHAPPPSGSQYFSLDSNAIAETRTPGQVLYLAFGAPNASQGGFFPAGVNGLFNMSSAATAVTDGVSFTASPNPAPAVTLGLGMTTVTWSAPNSTAIEIHIGSPTGILFTKAGTSGSATTGTWVPNGLTFYLQDVSNGKALTAANTLATLVITVR
jgi:hypothetical protein